MSFQTMISTNYLAVICVYRKTVAPLCYLFCYVSGRNYKTTRSVFPCMNLHESSDTFKTAKFYFHMTFHGHTNFIRGNVLKETCLNMFAHTFKKTLLVLKMPVDSKFVLLLWTYRAVHLVLSFIKESSWKKRIQHKPLSSYSPVALGVKSQGISFHSDKGNIIPWHA